MYLSQGKSEENGNEVPKEGRDPRALKIMGKNRRQKYACEKQSTEKKQWPWDAKNIFFEVKGAKNDSSHDGCEGKKYNQFVFGIDRPDGDEALHVLQWIGKDLAGDGFEQGWSLFFPISFCGKTKIVKGSDQEQARA